MLSDPTTSLHLDLVCGNRASGLVHYRGEVQSNESVHERMGNRLLRDRVGRVSLGGGNPDPG